MNFYKFFKSFICFILLYTIFFTNTSTFYIFANEIDETTTNQKENIIEDTNINDIENKQQLDDPLGLTAESAVLIDAKTGIVIYDKDKDAKSYPASTTKILTALLAIENTKPTDILTHSHNSVFNIGPGSSHIGMRENEQITMEQALNGVLLASANEVCMAIAEHISGSEEKFVELMNNKAKELGAKNTNFVNPHGFHHQNHYTTSYDIALIMKEAIKNEEFVKYISTTTYKIPVTNIVNEERVLNNTNKLILKRSPYYYEYCVGGKTGFTNEAGNTLVTYAKKDNIELIAVVMKDQGFKVYEDTKALFEYGFSNYQEKEIFNKEGYKDKVPVVQKYKDKEIPLGDIYLVAEESLNLNLPKSVEIEKIQMKNNIPNPVVGPISIGDKIGTLDFLYEGNKIASINVISKDKVDIIDETKLDRKEKIKSILFLLLKVLKYLFIGIVVFFVFVFIIRRIVKSKRRAKMKNRYRNNIKPLKPAKNNKNIRRRRK
ncbi:D-alanyl-D-alanine carboxypeptidase family protein [uncultured Tyzzerella sp.]|uniref:D-alanyl-D-alanine carboxypeptidase family protein n=1 Tax=uncultured Tyzzerella sp. TaxID=2321398 RepID=UPI002942E8A5|nr:D-alanyl-D-alanine carboxypeptidase family protein [uncultured Tyzzerella sp.]